MRSGLRQRELALGTVLALLAMLAPIPTLAKVGLWLILALLLLFVFFPRLNFSFGANDEIPEWAVDLHRKLDVLGAALPPRTSSVSIAAPAAQAQANALSPELSVPISGNQSEGFAGKLAAKPGGGGHLLTPEAEALLKKELSRVHGAVGFTALEGDLRGIERMRELADVFSQSGWAIRGMREATFRSPIEGLYIQASSAPAAYAGFVQSALQSVGIEAKGAIAPLPEDEIEILLGATKTGEAAE